MKSKKSSITSIIGTILGIIFVIVLVISVGLYVQVKVYNEHEDYCNDKYGEGNWEFVNTRCKPDIYSCKKIGGINNGNGSN